MTDEQRQQLAKAVITAREARYWSQARLAKEAGITQTTLGHLEAARSVRPSSAAAVMAALDLGPLTLDTPRAGYTPDVEIIRDVIGRRLQALPEADRAEYAARLLEV